MILRSKFVGPGTMAITPYISKDKATISNLEKKNKELIKQKQLLEVEVCNLTVSNKRLKRPKFDVILESKLHVIGQENKRVKEKCKLLEKENKIIIEAHAKECSKLISRIDELEEKSVQINKENECLYEINTSERIRLSDALKTNNLKDEVSTLKEIIDGLNQKKIDDLISEAIKNKNRDLVESGCYVRIASLEEETKSLKDENIKLLAENQKLEMKLKGKEYYSHMEQHYKDFVIEKIKRGL